jgi:hypothetical protein
MEVLDTTIANVALRCIAGGLSAAVIDSDGVRTSYLAANATISRFRGRPFVGNLSVRRPPTPPCPLTTADCSHIHLI